MTNQERKEMIQLHNQGWSYRQLAEKFGVNKSTISEHIKKYEARKKIKVS